MYCVLMCIISCFFFFKQKTAYEMRISDWSSDVCSSDLGIAGRALIVEVVDGCEIAKRPSAILTGGSVLVAVIGKDRCRRARLQAGNIDPDQRLLFGRRPFLDVEFKRRAVVTCDEAQVRTTEIGRAHV